MPWSTTHHDTCQKLGMWQATINLASYVYRQCKSDESTELELDRGKFDKHMIRTRGEAYHRTYFPKIVHQLEELSNGAVVILQDFHRHGVYKLLVRPISFAIENGKTKPKSTLGQTPGNPMYSEAQKKKLLEQQQQEKDINQMENLLAKLGMKYSRSALLEMWRKCSKSLDEFTGAVAFMLDCHNKQTKPITNAYGWLRTCISRGDHLNYLHQIFHQLPTFKDPLELNAFVTCYLYEDEPEEKTKIWAESKVPKIFNPWDNPVPSQ